MEYGLHQKAPYCVKKDFNDTIAVHFGGSGEQFTLHRAILSNNCGYFRAACSTSWVEGQERVVRLPGHRVATFASYSHSIYFHELDFDGDEEQDDEAQDQTMKACIDLYGLATYLQDSELHNRIVDKPSTFSADNSIVAAHGHSIVLGNDDESRKDREEQQRH